MTDTTPDATSASRIPDLSGEAARRQKWGAAAYLAAAAIPLLAYQAWTLGAWLLDAPHPVAKYRETGGAGLIFARVTEVATILLTAAVVVVVVRGCRREHRLTFDAMLLVGLALAVFWDTLIWVDGPTWLYSENWLNLNDWWGNAPLVANPVAGAAPMPVVMQLGMYVGFPFAVLTGLGTLMRRAQARWPGLQTAGLLGIVALVLVPAFLVGSYVLNALHLWSAGDVHPFIITGDDWRVSIGEPCWAVLWGVIITAFWFRRDSHGHALTERGLDRLPPRMRTVVSLLATIAFVSLSSMVLEGVLIGALHVLQPQPYPALPKSLLGEVCEAPGWDSTVFGPCPA